MSKPAPKKPSKRPKPKVVEIGPDDVRLVGRPRMEYNHEVAMLLLEEIAEGEQSLRQILDEAPKGTYPSRATINRWLRENDDFASLYAEAKGSQQDSFVDDTIFIADKATPEDVAVAKLRVQTRQWSASRIAPKKYGDHLDLSHTGIVQTQNIDLLRHLTQEERDRLRVILTAASRRMSTEDDTRRIGKQIEGKAVRR